MKRLLLVFLLTYPVFGCAQQTMKDFLYQNSKVIWFGLDFSKVKLIGSEGFKNPNAIKESHFNHWNRLIYSEPAKYDWGKVLRIPELIIDTVPVSRVNSQVQLKNLISNKSYSVSNADIEQAIKGYEVDGYDDGIGIAVVVESLDKVREMGFVFIVFFNVKTQVVIYMHKLVGEAKGYGFRNYWSGAIHHWLKITRNQVMKDIEKKYR